MKLKDVGNFNDLRDLIVIAMERARDAEKVLDMDNYLTFSEGVPLCNTPACVLGELAIQERFEGGPIDFPMTSELHYVFVNYCNDLWTELAQVLGEDLMHTLFKYNAYTRLEYFKEYIFGHEEPIVVQLIDHPFLTEDFPTHDNVIDFVHKLGYCIGGGYD